MFVDVGSYTLGGINVGLAAGLGLMHPLLLQVDLFLTGQFGLGPFMADIQAQFSAAISAVLQLNLSITDPLQAIRALITAFASLQASLAVALSFGLPSVQIGLQVSAMASLAAGLSIKIGGIKALLAAGLSAKIPALQFVARIDAALNAGPAHLATFRGTTLAASGAEIAAAFAAGLGPSDPLHPNDFVDGILIVTKDPVVFQALAAIMKTG